MTLMYIDHNHASMLGTYLHCPSCNTPRFAKRGAILTQAGELRPVWYLGCDCPKPSSVL